MGMFYKYNHLPSNYTPKNTPPYRDIYRHKTLNDELPRKVYDENHNVIGFSWCYGDTFKFPISVEKVIYVYNDTIIYDVSLEKPTEETDGAYIGQKALNIVDLKSWTYQGTTDGANEWFEDAEFQYPFDGNVPIILPTDMEGKSIVVDFYTFRWEHFYTFTNTNHAEILCDFNEEVSKMFVRGVYNCLVRVTEDNESQTVKRYMIIVD